VTRRGIGLIAAAVILFLLADMTRTGWIQFADSLLWAIVVAGSALPLLSLPSLDVAVSLLAAARREGLREGDGVTVAVRIRNRWLWPRFGLRVTGELQAEGRAPKPIAVYVPFIAPRGEVQLRGEAVITERGLYRLRNVRIESSAPVAVLRRRKGLTADSQTLILPAPIACFSAEMSRPAEGTIPRNRPAHSGDDIAGSRPYVPGDPARAVHWRNFARTGRLMTKTYTSSAGDTPVLVIAPPSAITDFDEAARLAAGVVEEWTKEGGRVRWQNGTMELQQTRDEMMRTLAVASPAAMAPAGDSLRWLAPAASAVAVVSARDRAGVRQVAAAAARLSARLTVLLVAPAASPESQEAKDLLARSGATLICAETPLSGAAIRAEERERRAA
jgi:uncharacterized protein (DUF58 family)